MFLYLFFRRPVIPVPVPHPPEVFLLRPRLRRRACDDARLVALDFSVLVLVVLVVLVSFFPEHPLVVDALCAPAGVRPEGGAQVCKRDRDERTNRRIGPTASFP